MPNHPDFTLDLRNNPTADKAVVAMVLLRLSRPDGREGKGIGPNRDDLPIFEEITNQWATGERPANGRLFQARHRVSKYHNQLKRCHWLPMLQDRTTPLDAMVDIYRQDGMRIVSEKILAKELEELKADNYGNW